jgi:hypothetical protein
MCCIGQTDERMGPVSLANDYIFTVENGQSHSLFLYFSVSNMLPFEGCQFCSKVDKRMLR